MTDTLETHRSFVNTWECDENAHLNVQFYLKRFDEAARFFALLSAGGGHDGPLPRDRNVRYHAELAAGATTLVRSAAISGGAFDGHVVHFLEDAETGRLSATSLDTPSGTGHAHAIAADAAERALPRSAPHGSLEAITPRHILGRGGLVAHRAIVGPGDCDAAGTITERFHVACLSDAAAHAWSHAGAAAVWLGERGLGRVAVEMKITHHAPAMAGDAIAVYSAPTAATGRTVTLRHEIVRAADDRPVASAEVVALILDLSTRRPVALPEPVAARMARASASS